MPPLFNENTSQIITLPTNSNLINYSVLKEFYSPSPFRSFSIKYVVEGNELYSVNGNKYFIRNQQYLLANKHSEGFVEVDSKKSVIGICIDVAPEILSEVVASHLEPDTALSDIELDRFFTGKDFLENKYNAKYTRLGTLMIQLEQYLLQNPEHRLEPNKEFYYSLSEKIVEDHIPVFKQLQSVRAIKTETRKILLRKIMLGKEFINEFFKEDLSIAQIAKEVGLSEYHFFRLFKSVCGLSPHQYIIQKKLEFSRFLIQNEPLPLSEVALLAGFSDISTFSKSFKKHFGTAPSTLLKK